ncbi:MAG: divalent cation transporter, partial [Thermoplasmata archaeon]
MPALLVLIPPAIGMRGNIFASLGSRLGTYLHTGEVVIGKKSGLLKENINVSFALTFSMSIYIGIIAWAIARHIGMKVNLIDLALISIFAGIFSAFLMIFFTFLISFLSFKKGWNPDNITAPLITLAGDII